MNQPLPQIIKAVPIELDPNSRTQDAYHQIVEACLIHATANVPLINLHVADGVHQCRVALRRLRSAIALFSKQLDKTSRKQVIHELRSLGKMLSPARDWDVFLTETIPSLPPTNGIHDLLSEAERNRSSAYAAIRRDAWDSLRDKIARIKVRGHDLDEPISDTAPDLLGRQARKVKRCVQHLNTPVQRHALRKALKKLRYSVEFVGSLYEAKEAKRYLDHCKDAQELLGKMNDTATTVGLLSLITTTASHDLIAWAKDQNEKSAEQVPEIVRQLRAAKRFW